MKYEDKHVTHAEFDSYWKNVGILTDERVQEIFSLCPKVDRAIDLGGGSSGLANLFTDTPIVIVDWSPVACDMARQAGHPAFCQNILDFCKEHEYQYDLVVLGDVLEEMKMSETEALLDGVKKLCKKYFVISTPTHENYLNLSTHQVIYSKPELIAMIEERGFTMDAEIKYSDRLMARFVYEENKV